MTRRTVGTLTTLLLGALAAGPVQAATFTVTKFVDTADGVCDADCSLREAVIAANSVAGDDVIALAAGTYLLTISGTPGIEDEDASVGDLDILTSFGGVSIQGAGSSATTIDATGLAHRHFHVPENFSAVTVSLSGLTLRGGNVSGFVLQGIPRASSILARSRFVTAVNLTDVVVRDNSDDSAIVSTAPLTLTECTVRDNAGGGIHFTTNAETTGTSKASTIDRSAIVDNEGPAITAVRAASNKQHSFTVLNSTLSGNDWVISPTSTLGAVTTTTNATLRNVTITGDGGRGISALFDFYGTPTVQVQSSIVSGNDRGDILGFGQDDSVVLPVSLGHNVIGDGGAGAFTQPTDLVRTDPLLGALDDNGGPTPTHLPDPESPAIDRGDAATCPATDQRGVVRPIDGDGDSVAACDVGAVEVEPGPCRNGLDDDGDGRIDAADRGCSGAADDSERGSDVCDDGLDNDGDGLADMPDDPGCPLPYATLEDPPCDDGLDNDANGLTDFEDPKCTPYWPYWEVTPRCGLGGEIALALPALFAWRRRTRR